MRMTLTGLATIAVRSHSHLAKATSLYWVVHQRGTPCLVAGHPSLDYYTPVRADDMAWPDIDAGQTVETIRRAAGDLPDSKNGSSKWPKRCSRPLSQSDIPSKSHWGRISPRG